MPRLRLLTGTRSQQAAIVLAVRPVARELIPGLEAAGLEVSSIALLPALDGSDGEPLQAQVEQVNGTHAFIIRLAHLVGAEKVGPAKDSRSGVVPQPRAAAKEETEGTVVAFRPTPLGSSTNGHAT